VLLTAEETPSSHAMRSHGRRKQRSPPPQINGWSMSLLLLSFFVGMREWSDAGAAHPEGASGQMRSTAHGAWSTT